MTPEQKVQNKIIAYLKKEKESGAPVFWEKRQAGGFTYKVGLPDLYFIYNGRHCEVEIKSASGSRNSNQITFEMIFKKINVPYLVTNSLESFIEFYESIKKEECN